MNMIRINPSSAANLTMGHHLLDLCGRYMEIWAKTSNQTAPHGTHFWAPLQQRERERITGFCRRQLQGLEGLQGLPRQRKHVKTREFPKMNLQENLYFSSWNIRAMPTNFTSHQFWEVHMDLNCVWVKHTENDWFDAPFHWGNPGTMPTQKWFQVSRSDLQYYLDPVKSHPSYPSCKTRRL